MIKNVRTKLIIALVVVAASVWAFFPPAEKINLGLDLRGGMHLVLEVQTEKVIAGELEQVADNIRRLLREDKSIPFEAVRTEGQRIVIEGLSDNNFAEARQTLEDYYGNAFQLDSRYEQGRPTLLLEMQAQYVRELERSTVQQSKETLTRRIDAYGVSEPNIQLFGGGEGSVEKQIIVELPGVEDPEEVKELLKKTASLQLQLVHPTAARYVPRQTILESFGGQLPEGYELVQYTGHSGQESRMEGETYILVKSAPVITGKHMTGARPSQDTQMGLSRPAVSFTLNSEGAQRFERATSENIGKSLAIILDGKAISDPVIEGRISDSGIITGLNGPREAEILALSLRSGALPADILILEERTVGPSLGLESIKAGINAMLLGLVLVIVFILLYYRLSGFNAILCLVINLAILLGALGYLQGVLTLPGIAGIILTIGMAVDSNVLIFERIREELMLGKAVRTAVEAGFSKAALTIMDANVTTLIAAAFLYQFGTGPIRGFAVTLTAGLLANLFAAIFVSRALFEFILEHWQVKKLSI
jgi:preprotein translocase subunit SecD